MAHASSRRRSARSPREWAVRAGLAAVTLVLGYGSTKDTLGYTLIRTSPERAYALAPGDGRIAGALAQQIAATADASTAERGRADALAHKALAAEPLAVTAITALALDKQIAGDTGGARRLFAHSDGVSRRELGTRLWLIEDAVARGDIPGALRNYDIALRTEKSAADLLFPILSSAVADPAIAVELLRTLAKSPTWADAFVFQLGFAESDPKARAAFLARVHATGRTVPPASQAGILNALIAAGEIDQAWRFYAVFRPGAARDRSRDPTFTATFETPGAFDWNPVIDDRGISTSIQSAPGGGIFDFAVPATVSGVILQQAQALRPGTYRIAGKSADIDQDPTARPYWTLVCGDGRETGRVELPNSSVNGGRFDGVLTVPEGCPIQFLRLVARASSATGGLVGRLERAALAPVTAAL